MQRVCHPQIEIGIRFRPEVRGSTLRTMSGFVTDPTNAASTSDTPDATAPRRGLDPSEAADAAAVAALVFVSTAVGRLLAFGVFFQLMSSVVMAVLASRRRPRVVVTAGVTAASIGILLGGIGPLTQIGAATLFGGATGTTIRRGGKQLAAIGRCLLIGWPIVSIATIGFLLIFSEVRELNFENARNLADGTARLISGVGLDPVADGLRDGVDLAIDWWYLATPLLQILITVLYAIFTYRVAKPVIGRVNKTLGDPLHHDIGAPGEHRLPQWQQVEIRRADASIATIDLSVEPGQLVALTGPNGAGKSSTIGALAGFDGVTAVGTPTAVGLGRPRGVAVIGQRPDAQILTPRVRDELSWGGNVDDAEVMRLLERVGIAPLAERDSASLSGGEMQRLAIAAALAMEPQLLLSDESTSMLDPDGRVKVAALLREVADAGAGVVHASHVLDDLAIADSTTAIGEMQRVIVPDPDTRGPGDVVMSARGLRVVHDAGSPWAVTALDGVDLELREGELTLLTGGNGSGKTTLAWALAGLIPPAAGSLELRGQPMDGPDDRVALAFQHARLQLLSDKVRDEVESLSGREDVDGAMRAMGLDPYAMASRRVDHLSGGEQRRVLLAGMLARRLDVVVLDEPLAGLDGEGRERLRAAVHRFLSSRTAVVVVSHELDWAPDLVHQRISLLDGRVAEVQR